MDPCENHTGDSKVWCHPGAAVVGEGRRLASPREGYVSFYPRKGAAFTVTGPAWIGDAPYDTPANGATSPRFVAEGETLTAVMTSSGGVYNFAVFRICAHAGATACAG